MPLALEQARALWSDAELLSVSAHGLMPSGEVQPGSGGSPAGLWFFAFRVGDGIRGLACLPSDRGEMWSPAPDPPPRAAWRDEVALDLTGVADSDVLAQRFCGLAGWESLAGRVEDGLLVHAPGGQLVARICGAGDHTAVLDAREPDRVISVNFEPVQLQGEVV
ncbi:MAG: hypothetical protein AB2A00_12815 [Myxococcota bacterium]